MAPQHARDSGLAPHADDPFRVELLGADGLASRARTLASAQSWKTPTRGRWRHIQELARSAGDGLARDYQTLSADARADVPVPPAGEWLLDNSYLIDEQVRHIVD